MLRVLFTFLGKLPELSFYNFQKIHNEVSKKCASTSLASLAKMITVKEILIECLLYYTSNLKFSKTSSRQKPLDKGFVYFSGGHPAVPHEFTPVLG
jgi:hypothetical protein